MIYLPHFLSRAFPAFLVWAALLFCCSMGHAAEPPTGGEQALLAKYASIKPKLEQNQFDAPIYLESVEEEGTNRVDMYGVFDYGFDGVKEALLSPANWCDITSLHINIKACTSNRGSDHWKLTLYSGRKHYQPPADAYPLRLTYKVVSQGPEYLDLALVSDEGPLGTKDHRIRVQAAPLGKTKTFLHFGYSYSHGSMARMAIKGYFGTLGRDKVGFSVTGNKDDKPVYVGGVRGAIERNTVRYYLAMQTYMDSLKLPQAERFEQRISRWYDLTAKYPRQLKELEKEEYLANKRREHKNQVTLQKEEGDR